MLSFVVLVEELPFHLVFYGEGVEPPSIDVVEDALRRRGYTLWSDYLQRLRGYHLRVESYGWTGGRTPGQKGVYVDHTEEDSRYTNDKLWQLWRSDGAGRYKYQEEYRRKRRVLRDSGSDAVASRDTGGGEQSTGGDSAGT